ncbi:uncharacterized protein LOC143876899 [Tasmannia lanceolata]|uniref:uncharacterized protein LOC143876898 n=1 Tax=Tasmannia lanceolata TaxID=3420 RepID=UPI004064AD7B
MKIVDAWNVRGLCTSTKRIEVRDLIRKTQSPICCLIETKAKIHKLTEYSSFICDGWQVHGNYSSVVKERIWILWDPRFVNVNILEESSQFSHSEVRLIQTSQSFNLTAIYAHNYYISRRALWADLESIEPQVNLPWLLIGDFNVVRYVNERIGNTNHYLNETEEFNECIPNCALSDLRSNSHQWTWHNRSTSNRKLAKLDRTLVNELGLQNFAYSLAEFLTPGISDHCPITISLENHQSFSLLCYFLTYSKTKTLTPEI